MKSSANPLLNGSAVVIAICLLSFLLLKLNNSLLIVGSDDPVRVDYNNAIVIVLTAVTVIFSVSAIALAVLSVVGFKDIKKTAGNWAAARALNEIEKSFSDDGPAILGIKKHMKSAEFQHWMQKEIRDNVVQLLPLVADRLARDEEIDLEADTAENEGQID